MDYSKDGQILVAVAREFVRIWNLAGAREKLILGGHTAAVSCVVFSPDGKLLATSGRDHRIKIWDPITGALLKELTEFRTAVEGLSFSPDGSILAAGNYDNGTVLFYDVQSWKVLTVMQPSVGSTVFSTAFSADGQYFAAAGWNGVTLWRVVRGGGELTFRFPKQLTPVYSASICFSPDGNWLAWADRAWGADSTPVHVWDLRRSQPHAVSMARSRWVMRALAFSPDSKRLAFVSDEPAIAVWDVTTRQELASFGEGKLLQPRGGSRTHLSADGAWYAVADQTVTIWDMAAKKLLVALSPERSSVYSVGWSPDRELLAVGGNDGGLEIWNLSTINAALTGIGLGW